jgi:ribosomal protein S18 acetylase RimI-like enzyme
MGETGHAIEWLTAAGLEAAVLELGRLLRACVEDGASVGFILPFGADAAEAFWRGQVLPAARGGKRVVAVARQDGRIAGTVQLDTDTPANQPHRAEVKKLLVHPDFRRRGIARALMASAEALARHERRSLLTLDTRTGDAAEPLYLSMGYRIAGVIPTYCLDVTATRLDSTTVMYKAL